MLGPIEKAFFEAQLGMTPQNDGQIIRLVIPPVTEERRREFAKKAKHSGEESKVGVRAARQKAMEEIKKAVKAGLMLLDELRLKRVEFRLLGITWRACL